MPPHVTLYSLMERLRMYTLRIQNKHNEVLLNLNTLCDDVRFMDSNRLLFQHQGALMFTLDVSSLWLRASGALLLFHNPV